MLTDILILLIVVAGALLGSHSGRAIARRPYNNVYSDASGAREDHLG